MFVPGGVISIDCYRNPRHEGFVSGLLQGEANWNPKVLYDGDKQPSTVCPPVDVAVIDAELEYRNVVGGKDMNPIPVLKVVCMDASHDLFKAQINSALSLPALVEQITIGSTLTITDFVVIWMQDLLRGITEEEDEKRAVVLINNFSWTQPPNKEGTTELKPTDSYYNLLTPAGLEQEKVQIHIPLRARVKQQNILALSHCHKVPAKPDHLFPFQDLPDVFMGATDNSPEIPNHLFPFHEHLPDVYMEKIPGRLIDYSFERRFPLSSDELSQFSHRWTAKGTCECMKKYGFLECITITAPVDSLDYQSMYEQISVRLQHGRSGGCYEDLDCHLLRYLALHWYEINPLYDCLFRPYLNSDSHRITHPSCVVYAVIRHFPSPSQHMVKTLSNEEYMRKLSIKHKYNPDWMEPRGFDGDDQEEVAQHYRQCPSCHQVPCFIYWRQEDICIRAFQFERSGFCNATIRAKLTSYVRRVLKLAPYHAIPSCTSLEIRKAYPSDHHKKYVGLRRLDVE